MPFVFPSSPANGDRTILGGVEYQFTSPKWKRYRSSVIDSGFSGTIVTLDEQTTDGGDSNGV
jgi:hypothetical protein